MAVFRVERTRDYTVMANHHLRNTELSLKAKGLLSVMLSLPEEWNYTTRGLSAICREGVDCIGAALRELENAGYIVRTRLRDEKGRITDTEYVIYEQPHTENPYMEEPHTEKPAQLNTDRRSTDESSTESIYPITSDRMGSDAMDVYRDLVRENIDYDALCEEYPRSRLDEIVELMAETLATKKTTITIAGDKHSASTVKFKLMRINSLHIQYVFESLEKNTTEIRNIKKYLLAALFNAPSTMNSYYHAQLNQSMD